MKLFRNTVALEKDEDQVIFINMRIKALWECPDQDEEVGAKNLANTERFQPASREPIPPLAGEPGELIELDDELIEDISLARLTGETNACIAEETSIRNEEENDIGDLIAM